MQPLITSLFLILTKSLFAQQIQYVKANNGLIVRESPYKKSNQIGKLEYGTRVRVINNFNNISNTNIQDGDENVIGQWVKIQEINGLQKGYVFSGYLTSERLKKRIQIKFEEFELEMELDVWDKSKELKKVQNDSLKVFLSLGESIENKKIKLKQLNLMKIEIFQRHENSVTIMNEGPHCDLTNWKHYYSDWEKLDYDINENTFIFYSYQQEDREKFVSVTPNELKEAVKKECGEQWSELVEKVKNVNEYPSGVSMSQIILKILITNENGSITEKTISFVVPMGC